MIYKLALIGIITIAPAQLAAELVLIQGQRGASLEGEIDNYRLVIDCTADWGSQGLANFMLEPQAEIGGQDLMGISTFRYRFGFNGDLPINLEDGASIWVTATVEEFNNRLFWDVPITDALSDQFYYAHSLTIDFMSKTGSHNLNLIMEREEGLLTGSTGLAWNSFLEICMSTR